MSLDSVRAFFASHAPDIKILEMESSTATVGDAARVHGVQPAQIAKTLAVRIDSEFVIIIIAGDARLDNKKCKAVFGAKPSMLSPEEALFWTGHPVGGVCPFGLSHPLRIFIDVSLRRLGVVYPAAGATNAAVTISPERLAELTRAAWIDVGAARTSS